MNFRESCLNSLENYQLYGLKRVLITTTCFLFLALSDVMGCKFIDGKEISRNVIEELSAKVFQFQAEIPTVAFLRIGDNPSSIAYLENKKIVADRIEIKTYPYVLPENSTEEDLINLIDTLNADKTIHGILVQLPLPEQIDATRIINRVNPNKDVDGLHALNLGKLCQGDSTGFVPCTVLAVSEIIHSDYLIGADGVHSSVRSILEFPFLGRISDSVNFTFNCEVQKGLLSHDEMYQFITESKRLIAVPIIGDNKFKFSGNLDDIPYEDFNKRELIDLDNEVGLEMKNLAEERAAIRLSCEYPEGLSFYRVSSNITTSFSTARVFLVGDAAHVFSPAGGYGLNIAIEDAFSTGWRIAFSQECSGCNLTLLSYGPEKLENAVIVKADSDNKLRRTKHNQLESKNKALDNNKAEKEVQLYDRKLTYSFENGETKETGKVDAFLSASILESLSVGDQNLLNILNQNLNFTLIVIYSSRDCAILIKQLVYEFNNASIMKIKVIFIGENSNDTSEGLFYRFQEKNIHLEFCSEMVFLFISPDNFVRDFVMSENNCNVVEDLIYKYVN